MRNKSLLEIPRRQELIARLESANRRGIAIICLQLIIIGGLAMLIDWNTALHEPLFTTVAIAAVVGPFAFSVLTHVATKKKELGDLQEQTRFGQFDKHRLRTLFDDTLRRLNLPRRQIPVYVVAGKFTNASMLHVGLGFILRSLNGIYLNRQSLHKLNADEIQDVIGHELGHYYRYYLIVDRFRLVTLTMGTMFCILIVQLVGPEFGIFGLMICTSALWWVMGMPYAVHAWTIEYLCDDLGAQVHSVPVSVTGLMKLGAEAELLAAVQLQAQLSKSGSRLGAHEIVDVIESSIPYGHASREYIEAEVNKSLKQREQQGASLAGFLRYMWRSDLDAEDDEELERLKRQLQKLQSVPRIQWEALLPQSNDIRFDEWSMEKLVQLIEQNPDQALFRTPDELEISVTHPPLKQRILYLWRNRHEIESKSSR